MSLGEISPTNEEDCLAVSSTLLSPVEIPSTSKHEDSVIVPRGLTIWFTGLSGAGKSTISDLLERRLRLMGVKVELLDGDVVRTHLSRGLSFGKEDRDENIRRIGFVCDLLSRNGVIAIAAAISPYRAARDAVRRQATAFVEIY